MVGLPDGLEILFFRHQVDGVPVGHAEQVKSHEEGNAEILPQILFHFLFTVILETAQIFWRFIQVTGLHDGNDDAPRFGGHIRRIVAFAALV